MGKPEAPPPSYDEAINTPMTLSENLPQGAPLPAGRPSQSSRPTNQFQPPPQPPRPTQSQSFNQGPPQGQQPDVPWRYPNGFWCHKCHNTGKKLKNGKSCQNCWERFAPRARRAPNVHLQTVYNGYTQSSNLNFGGFQLPFGSNNNSFNTTTTSFNSPGPRYVQPGDPAIGGVQCGKCRGKGMVRFFLDEEHW
ncbi:Cortactin-binding protein [Wickerhamomyces ciferrii]|uniref:Cortactin-binding protein n=1 Tax=Wickerhamomyces ciferrii (strain ATCC 14091 / BCRC 22168 / CBS 111 / JCM 3599 / NBRC 0793 / NRRL Y-1031 F-60-10) TaxID=1206466 RepID=K0KFE5_WICCF|nr:Cortactin-binding protein [Wickerhamomyces ciferrii]CCH41661.1 Cortactin-binding protein [Wickerhamomyces ciferrii]